MNSVIVRYVLKKPSSFSQVDEKLDLALLSMEKTTAAEGWGQGGGQVLSGRAEIPGRL